MRQKPIKQSRMKQKHWLALAAALAFSLPVLLGCFLWLSVDKPPTELFLAAAKFPQGKADAVLNPMKQQLAALQTASDGLHQNIAADQQAQKEQTEAIAVLAEQSKKNKNLSMETYEKMIVNRLGEAVSANKGKNSEIMIFRLEKADFRGYMAKIKLKSEKALRVTMAPKDKPGGETTLQAAKRLGATLAINGGGFATQTTAGVARLVPMGNTMIEGNLVANFQPDENGFAFAGFSKGGKLVGGSYQTQKALMNSGAWQGVSFVPALIRDWEPTKIPAKWAKSRQPRSVLGQYPNGDLFFIVVDGRQSDWSNGITLEEMQKLLLELGVMEAFNLDGGGSSTFVYDGAVRNKPSDGSARKLATNLVILL